MQEKFDGFREKYPEFIYKDYHIEVLPDEYIKLTYDFDVPGLSEFHPSNKIRISNLNIMNDPESKAAERIAFSLGMVELVSYWKIACPKKVRVLCGSLSEDECSWWKKLYFGGLGEFFFKNNIKTSFEEFMTIYAEKYSGGRRGAPAKGVASEKAFVSAGFNIIPVGGGKDSNVSMELTKAFSDKVYCFTVNDQPAREESAACAGYNDDRMLRTYRTLDKNMLELNKKGYLNGHTPFSAIVAFLSLYCAYIIGADNIILSNESSANESNIEGKAINHQYSKSYEFEKDFCNYSKTYIGAPIHYFSLLRPFNELQIAKKFASLKKYNKVFKSCNAGSKKNIWCCNCAKCLFVYIIISPFMTRGELLEIFYEDLLEREDLKDIFDGLVGFSEVKPFECVGTHEEINAALKATAEKYLKAGEELPYLLDYYYKKADHNNEDYERLLKDFNEENGVPDKFMPAVKEMYELVSKI